MTRWTKKLSALKQETAPFALLEDSWLLTTWKNLPDQKLNQSNQSISFLYVKVFTTDSRLWYIQQPIADVLLERTGYRESADHQDRETLAHSDRHEGHDLWYFYCRIHFGLAAAHCYHGASLFLALYKSCYLTPTVEGKLLTRSLCQHSIKYLFIYVKTQSFRTQQFPQ